MLKARQGTHPVDEPLLEQRPAGGQRVAVGVGQRGAAAGRDDPGVRQRAHVGRHALDVLGRQARPRRDQPAARVPAAGHVVEVAAGGRI